MEIDRKRDWTLCLTSAIHIVPILEGQTDVVPCGSYGPSRETEAGMEYGQDVNNGGRT